MAGWKRGTRPGICLGHNEVVYWMALPSVPLGAPVSAITDPDKASKMDARIAFDLHKCGENSLARQKYGRDYP